jgi:predicted flap endonuclease-1-like 5' DNA nuclease
MNLTGDEYYAENNVANEEAIYLTYDSDVTVGTSGVEKTGIENSVRVAFAQIGRVENKQYQGDDVKKVTGITCADDETNGVTGICRLAQIWEPNDTDHIANAISFYDTACTQRTGEAT